MLTTRMVTENDKDFVWKVKVASMRSYVEQLYGWEDGHQYDHFEKTFHPDTTTIIQYERQDAGMIELWEREEDLFLSRIEVLPEFQKRGLGTAIIQKVVDGTAAAGKPLRLQVVKINPARRLYERLGFVKTAETETHIQMERPDQA